MHFYDMVKSCLLPLVKKPCCHTDRGGSLNPYPNPSQTLNEYLHGIHIAFAYINEKCFLVFFCQKDKREKMRLVSK